VARRGRELDTRNRFEARDERVDECGRGVGIGRPRARELDGRDDHALGVDADRRVRVLHEAAHEHAGSREQHHGKDHLADDERPLLAR
jgi:hypothetical protein